MTLPLPLPRAHGPAPAPAASLSPVALQFTVTQLTSSRESASEHRSSPRRARSEATVTTAAGLRVTREGSLSLTSTIVKGGGGAAAGGGRRVRTLLGWLGRCSHPNGTALVWPGGSDVASAL